MDNAMLLEPGDIILVSFLSYTNIDEDSISLSQESPQDLQGKLWSFRTCAWLEHGLANLIS